MANVKISALPAATAINAADLLPVVQGGVTKQVTPDLLPLSAAAIAALAGKETAGAAAAAQAAAIASISSLVGAAPAALDTLKEIDDQLAADEGSAAALAAAVATKQDAAQVTAAITAQATADAATYATITRRSTLHALGDSLSANGINTGAATGALASADSRSVWTWAHVLSGARLRIGAIGATGGYTSTQIRATHLPTVLAAVRPGDMVAVLAGTNDGSLTTGRGGSETQTNMTAMYDAIRAAGGIPVVCTIPPVTGDDTATAATRIRYNLWLERTARTKGYLFLDFYSLLIDPATNGYTTGLNNDNVHPNGGGARKMGQLAATVLTPPNAPQPFFAAHNIGTGGNPPDGVLAIGNACMVTDSDGNGRADQFEFGFGTLTGGSGFSLVTEPGVIGRMQKVTHGATGPDDVTAVTGYAATCIPGHRYYIAFKFKIDLTDPAITSDTRAVIQVIATDTGAISEALAGITFDGWDFSTPGLCAWASEAVAPAGATLIQVFVSARGGPVSVSIGQLTIIDLTALGVADTTPAPAATNLLTLNQASIETDATGWGGNGDGAITVARSTTYAADGAASLLVTGTATAQSAILAAPGVAVTAGQNYGVTVKTRAATTTRIRQVEFYWYDSAHGFLAYNAGAGVLETTTGWTTITASQAAPAGAAFLRFGVASSGTAAGEQWYLDAAGVYAITGGAPVPAFTPPSA